MSYEILNGWEYVLLRNQQKTKFITTDSIISRSFYWPYPHSSRWIFPANPVQVAGRTSHDTHVARLLKCVYTTQWIKSIQAANTHLSIVRSAHFAQWASTICYWATYREKMRHGSCRRLSPWRWSFPLRPPSRSSASPSPRGIKPRGLPPWLCAQHTHAFLYNDYSCYYCWLQAIFIVILFVLLHIHTVAALSVIPLK